jgi:hypothetical protein
MTVRHEGYLPGLALALPELLVDGGGVALTWVDPGQQGFVHGLLHGLLPWDVRIQGPSLSFQSEPFPTRFKLTYGRRSGRLHHYPAYGGWAQWDVTILRAGG